MKILSIETSCDDTCITIFEAKGGVQNATFKILANNTNSQIKIHIPYGGVFPTLAKREHIKNLPILLKKSLKEAKLDKKTKPVDLIVVTSGPGLEPSLWSGIVFAKELAEKWSVPLMPVNHMEGHILSVFGKDKGFFKIKKLKTPILSLLVSGGHTELILTRKWMNYEIIGQTLDDAVGEAFDKVARMLGLPYPGGPEISKLAGEERGKQLSKGLRRTTGPKTELTFQQKNSNPQKSNSLFSLPRPMLHSKDFNFSFSGLKTAVLYLIKKISPDGKLSKKIKRQIALEFENAAIETLISKTKKAILKYKIKTIIVSGGVSANNHLRQEIDEMVNRIDGEKIKLLFPPIELSMDNSIMIGIAGYLNFIKNKKKVPSINRIKANGNLILK